MKLADAGFVIEEVFNLTKIGRWFPVQIKRCDRAYIERWTRDLELNTLWQECQT